MDSVELLFSVLVAAIASLWIPAHRLRRILSYGLLTLAGILAFALGKLSIPGIIWTGVLLATGRYYHFELSLIRYSSRWIFLGLVLALGFGILPGFEAITLHQAEVLKSGSAEYALRLRFDKVLAGFALLSIAIPLTRKLDGWRQIVSTAVPTLIILAPIVLGVGWLSAYIGLEPQVPEAGFLIVWAFSNLFFVTGVEEGFFRGLIQSSLSPRIGAYGAITIGAILFGLAHFGGGPLYVMLATLAGIGYGIAYHYSGQRIEAAMLTHFGVNLLHILLFTYPYSK